jgi:hypothetical protein
MAKCSSIKADGERCKGVPIHGSEWCPAHHPEYAAARRHHGRKGGKRGGRGRPVTDLANLRTENADIRKRLLEGELQPNVAAVAIQSINADARLVATTLKAREMEELETRMEAIEDALVDREETGPRGA